MKSKIVAILLFISSIGIAQVPDTETFSLDTVRKVLGLSATSDLSACFSTAVKGNFDPLYDSIGYAPVRSLKRFRNYQAVVAGCVEYGYLYNWYAAQDARNIAASGWRLPTVSDCQELAVFLGGELIDPPLFPGFYEYHSVGGYLKETGNSHWDSPNIGADNSSGFTSRGSGTRITYIILPTNFDYFKIMAAYFLSDLYASNDPYIFETTYNSNSLFITPITYPPDKDVRPMGASIRLIKDDSTLATYTGNDGKTYITVKIGNQVWMAENLAETKYRNGDLIPTVTDISWEALTTGAKCAYNNDESNVFE